jgi:hypothetical protein
VPSKDISHLFFNFSFKTFLILSRRGKVGLKSEKAIGKKLGLISNKVFIFLPNMIFCLFWDNPLGHFAKRPSPLFDFSPTRNLFQVFFIILFYLRNTSGAKAFDCKPLTMLKEKREDNGKRRTVNEAVKSLLTIITTLYNKNEETP